MSLKIQIRFLEGFWEDFDDLYDVLKEKPDQEHIQMLKEYRKSFLMLRDNFEGTIKQSEDERCAEKKQALMDSGFKPEEFSSLSLDEKLNQLGEDHLDSMEQSLKVVVRSHSHPLFEEDKIVHE